MFTLLKIISFIALLDFIIYSYYKKNYNVYVNSDCYKYRIIICSIFWFILGFSITYNILITENVYMYYLYSSIMSLILFLSLNIYNKYIYNSYSIKFMCVDIVFGVLITNLLILITLFIK